MALLIADRLSRAFVSGDATVHAVVDASIAIDAGERVALVGPSGCGKSSLLHLCGAMDRPTSGRVSLEGVALDAVDDDTLTRLRRDRVGFVFQFFNLLPTLTVEDNVALPLLLAGRRADVAALSARAMLDRVGLRPRLRHFPQQLSGGELQRAAVARALVHQPALLIADEPTGNLDSANGRRVLDLLNALNRELGVTMILATHAAEIAASADRVVHMRDGRIEHDGRPSPGVAADTGGAPASRA